VDRIDKKSLLGLSDLNQQFPATRGAVSSLDNHTQKRALQTKGAESVAINGTSGYSNADQTEDWPVFSVITPSLNQAQYLEECIDSVLSQGYPNLEYVIMDGGSTDKSVEIIKKYEKYLTYWQSQPDGGQYAAINDGFRKTAGGVMTWLNSDDKYHPNAFITVALLFQSRNDVEWITGRPNKFNENGDPKWICEYLVPYSRSNYLKKKFNDPWIQQEGTFWRRSLWESSGASLKTDLEYAGDLELWARFFRFACLYSIDALLAGYRVQPKSKISLFMDKYLKEADRILDREIQFFREGAYKELLTPADQIDMAEIREALALVEKGNSDSTMNFYERDGNLTLKSGYQLAIEFYERSKKLDPNNCSVYNSLGVLYWQDGEVKKAIEEFVKALRINPDFPDALINLGDVLTRIKETAKAEKLYSLYMSRNPQDKDFLKIVTVNNNY
jgi:glycosyltransferase involved in cell wall biosynthesis